MLKEDGTLDHYGSAVDSQQIDRGHHRPAAEDPAAHHARSPGYPSRPHAARLLQYAVARGKDTGRIGDHFGAVCDQIDHADAMLEDLRNRVLENRRHPERAARDWQDRLPLRPLAMARRDDVTRAVTFVLDGAVADAAVHAIKIDAMTREARIRQVRQQGEHLAEGSYGRQNRDAIAARETQIAESLRAVERAYHNAVEPPLAPKHRRIVPCTDMTHDQDLEME